MIFIVFTKAHAQNHDETKVPVYTLPEVIKTVDEDVINNQSSSKKKRRPEVPTLFENHVYGQVPEAYDSIKFTVTNDVVNAKNEKAHLKEIVSSLAEV